MSLNVFRRFSTIKHVSRRHIFVSNVQINLLASSKYRRLYTRCTNLSSPSTQCYTTKYHASSTSETHSDQLTELTATAAMQEDELFSKILIELKGHDPAVMKSYCKFCRMAADGLDVTITSIQEPTKDIKRLSLLKSAFSNKRHWVQYEARTHFRVIEVVRITGSTADTFLEYIQRNLPEGMAMKVTTHQLERLPEHLVPDEATQQRLEQEQRHELNQRQLHLEKLRLEGIEAKKAREEVKAKLERDFLRLQREQQENKQARESNELKGDVVTSREEALGDVRTKARNTSTNRKPVSS